MTVDSPVVARFHICRNRYSVKSMWFVEKSITLEYSATIYTDFWNLRKNLNRIANVKIKSVTGNTKDEPNCD